MSPQSEDTNTKKRLVRHLQIFGLAIGALAAVLVVNGISARHADSGEEQSFSEELAVPTVTIVHPKPVTAGNALTLPGTVQAYYAAPIYARVPGYVRAWYKDIGAKVRRGDVLADIDTPDVDQQIAQAEADLTNAQAARKQAENTSQRWANLLKIGGVSKQDAEDKASDLEVKTAMVKSAQANLDRLRTMKTFAHIVAPFDGVVTERSADIGTLVNAGAGTSAGSALFTVSDTHKMRVYVRVPQNYSAQIHDHLKAVLSLPEYPGQSFPAELVSTSDAISNQSNTLLVQLEADNPVGKLKAGAYAEVAFQLSSGAQNLSIPVSTLLFRADGLSVATLGEKNHAVLKPVKIAQDLGTTVEVDSGLTASDQVIDNPPDSLQNGDPVRVAQSNDRR
jgi:RND family efflux transporter MFP subunit